jgi:hypothetical protein
MKYDPLDNGARHSEGGPVFLAICVSAAAAALVAWLFF